MITHNGKYLVAATHHGMPIVAATMGGKMILDGKWLLPLTLQAILAAFGSAEAQRSSERRTTTSTASPQPTYSEHYSSPTSSTKTRCSSAHS